MQSQLARNRAPLTLRVGLPLSGGELVRAARARGLPVLFSANAFAQRYPSGHPREGEFRRFRLPDPDQFKDLDAALDSAGFLAAVRYGEYLWDVRTTSTWSAPLPGAGGPSMDHPTRQQSFF